MTQPEKYDAIVIGTGQGGGPLAGKMAGSGWKTAVIEREEFAASYMLTLAAIIGLEALGVTL